MKEKLKKILWFFANPRLLLCLGIAWMITNGWSYIFVAVGTALGIGWMAAVGGAYLTFLWVPFTPEKILTVIIAIFLLRKLFPNDEKTLKILIDLFEKVKAAEREAREKWKKRRAEKKNRETAEDESVSSDDIFSSNGEKFDDGEEAK
jgi:hypothetical protein